MSDDIDVALIATKAHAAKHDCCGNAEWRGHFCQYHQGFEDGYDAALLAVRPLPQVPHNAAPDHDGSAGLE
jgi:hypothetical protein